MTPERFYQLIDAYGAEPGRWPVESRSEAQALLALQGADVMAALAKARALDIALSEHAVAGPDPDLIRGIVANASLPQGRLPVWDRLWWWLSGAGMVAGGVCGIAAGMIVSPLVIPNPAPAFAGASSFDRTYASTIFGNIVIDGSER